MRSNLFLTRLGQQFGEFRSEHFAEDSSAKFVLVSLRAAFWRVRE
jgi:hypothetical protein